MAVFKCASCGANLELVKGTKIFTCKYCGTEQTLPEETVPSRKANKKVETLLKRGFMLLEDSEFKKADKYFDKVLDIEPENGTAYFGKLMAYVEISDRTKLALMLKGRSLRYNSDRFIKRVLEFSPELIREMLIGDFCKAQSFINEGKEAEALKILWSISRYFPEAEKIADSYREKFRPQFDKACSLMNKGNYEEALYIFDNVKNYYSEAQEKGEECCRMLNLLMFHIQGKARSLMEDGKYEEALSMFGAVERINVYYSNHHESGYVYLDGGMEEMYWDAPNDLEQCLVKLRGGEKYTG